jgi:hypothetical protein
MTDLEPLIRTQLDSLTPLPEGSRSDWVDVLERSGHRQRRAPSPAWRKRRWVLAAAIAGVIVVSVTAAFTFGLPILDFWQAQKAPPESRVVKNFAVLDQGAPQGMATDVIPHETRKVATFGDAILWIAPTKQGGFCTDLGGEGGCDRLGTVPLNVSWAVEHSGPAPEPDRVAITPGSDRTFGGLPVVDQVSGYVNARWANDLEIRFEDGDVIRPHVVWVSKPIEAGFFLQSIPAAHRRAGHLISEIVALDADGKVITSDSLGRNRSAGPPADAIVDREKQVAAIETAAGQVALRTAPTRYEGRCAWLEFDGEAIPATPCLPKGYENQAALGLAVHTFGGRSILYGECGYNAVEFVHEDGDSRTVDCNDGIVFTELTPADETGQVRALDHERRPLPGSTIPIKRLSQSR